MKVSINYEGKKHTGTIPESWDELTVKHFIGLESKSTDIEIIALLSGLDRVMLENSNGNFKPVIAKIAELFNEKPPEMEKAPKKPIIIEGKKIKFPKSVDFTSFGQQQMVKNLIYANKEITQIISEVFAIYAQPLIDGKIDSQRVEEVKKTIDNLPILMVFPYVVFFFKRLGIMRRDLISSIQISL